MKISKYNSLVPRSELYSLKVNGEAVDVLHACTGDFSTLYFEEGMVLEITAKETIDVERTFVKPLSKEIEFKADANKMTIKMTKKCDIAIYINNLYHPMPLFIFMNTKYDRLQELEKVAGDKFIHFEEGQVYDIYEMAIEEDSVIYIEQGAYVRGVFHAIDVNNFKIIGHGVIDGSIFDRHRGENKRTILCEECNDFEIRDVTIINPTTWITVLGGCDNAMIDGVREIAEHCGTDGFDLCGSTNVVVRNCFVNNNDDCVVIKAFPLRDGNRQEVRSWDRSPENILCENCTFINGPAGNAIEIGHELRTDYVKNVVFRNIDILSVHGHGAALSIHAGDRANVENVVFEDIRIYHCYDKVVDFRVIKSQFNHDEERGSIKNVVLKDIDLKYSNENPGYTISAIGGFDAEHIVDGVVFDNFKLNGNKVISLDDIDILTRHAHNIEFK